MRLNKIISWIVLCGLVAFSAAAVNAQQPNRVPGRIIAVKVKGSVTATNLTDHSQTKLADNDKLSQHYVVTTGAGSSAILVFSNGATLNVGSDTTLSIDEFLQDPFDSQIVVGNITEEPTSSTTKVNLSRGEVVGNVKHLHQDKGSTFSVNTPVGAAGIRGTTFRIVFKPDANGNVTFTLSTADGSISFSGVSTGTTSSVSVDTGKEISLTVDATVNADGTLTINTPPTVDTTTTTQDIPADTQAAIATAAQDILVNSAPVILNATGGDTGANPSGNNSGDNNNNQQKKDTTSSDPNTPSSTTTNGDGKG